MTGLPFRCRHCQRGSRYVYCSNDCFRAYSKKKRTSCSTCGHRGNDAGRICPECRKDPANKDWVRTPRLEFNGFEPDFFESASGGIDQFEPRPHRGKKAIGIVRMVAGGMRYREIAEISACSVRYVRKIADYWNKETTGMLRSIRKEVRK